MTPRHPVDHPVRTRSDAPTAPTTAEHPHDLGGGAAPHPDEQHAAQHHADGPRPHGLVGRTASRVRALTRDLVGRIPNPAAARGPGRTSGGIPLPFSLRRAPAAPTVARVFDGLRDGVPCFAPERPVIVDRVERDEVLTLLRSGSVLLHAARPLRDDLGAVDAAVPADLRSDGSWIWSDAVAYYLEHHWIAPDAELVAHLRAAPPARPLDAETWRRLSAAIRPDAWEGTSWPLD